MQSIELMEHSKRETGHPRLGVGAVITNDHDQILLVLRNRNPEKGMWSIPGGKVDPYEQLEHCVIREIKEEVNLEIAVKGLLCTAETIRPENEEHWVSVIYETTVVGGEAKNMEEGGAIGDLKWFSLNELPSKLACFTLPAIESIISRKYSASSS
ncbi:NUDIX domain-containing protein [Paenibacillus aquistagni]|uniref:NUDIX domain-containing protein n=1 Tax=Paenibacillus aquistagni TaxID=1852522 RepID=UPI002166904D|nr:NUDIX domain-containing protein [Paenibacillus aquistagni]